MRIQTMKHWSRVTCMVNENTDHENDLTSITMHCHLHKTLEIVTTFPII